MFVETPKQMKIMAKYPCSKCAPIFNSSPLLKRHIDIYHKNGNPTTQLFNYPCSTIKCVLCSKEICATSGINKIKKHLSETHEQNNITIKIKCNNCSSSFGNCVQASNHFKKYHGAVKNNPPARTTTNIGKKVNNIVPTIDTPDTLATPTKGSSSFQHAVPVSTAARLTLLEETRKELQLFTNAAPLTDFPADSPIPLSPDTATIYYVSSPEKAITDTPNESIISKVPPQNSKEGGESPAESEEEEDAIINRFIGLLKPTGMFCAICNKRTDAKTANSLQRHIKRYHPNIVNKEGTSEVHLTYPFDDKCKCPLCQTDYQFHGFKRHSRTVHPNHTFNLIISCSVCKLEFSNPRVASNHFTTHKGSHKKKDTAPKANTFKNLLNYSDINEDQNVRNNINNNSEGLSNLSRQQPVADLNDSPITMPRTSSPSKLSDLTSTSPVNLPEHLIPTPDNSPDKNTSLSNSILASSIPVEISMGIPSSPKLNKEAAEEVPIGRNSVLNEKTAEKEDIIGEQHSRLRELGVDINAMISDLLNDPTPALSPSSPIRTQGDTSLSSFFVPTLAKQIREIRDETDDSLFSPPVVTLSPPNLPNMPRYQPMEANREDAGLNNVEENNVNTPTPPV